VATIADLPAWHHGPVLSGGSNQLTARFRHGHKNWVLGYHPLFQVAAAAGWLRRPPYVVGGICMLAGYVWAAVRRVPRAVPDELVEFLRGEQLARLRRAPAPVG
jgi:poly-beta-1,6-N-acetyl-D-glucosamine synthase